MPFSLCSSLATLFLIHSAPASLTFCQLLAPAKPFPRQGLCTCCCGIFLPWLFPGLARPPPLGLGANVTFSESFSLTLSKNIPPLFPRHLLLSSEHLQQSVTGLCLHWLVCLVSVSPLTLSSPRRWGGAVLFALIPRPSHTAHRKGSADEE